jgi:hypothetical protein
MEMSPEALERMKTQPITEKQQFAIDSTCKKLGQIFRGTTKYDAWLFLDKYYQKAKETKPAYYNNFNQMIDNEAALRRYGRKMEENILSNDFSY